jgi:hypothetical protein
MDLHDWQTRLCWTDYEAQLLERGFWPIWEAQLEAKVTSADVTCCRCGSRPPYVGMTNGAIELGFVACGPGCGDWFFFVPAQQKARP